MRYTPHPTHSHCMVGLFTLDADDDPEAVRAAIVAERDKIFPWRDNLTGMRDHVRDADLGRDRTHRAPADWPTYPEGDGTLTHDAATARAIALCEREGVEFWALGRFGKVWGVRDGKYYELGRYAGAREIAPDHGRRIW